MSARPPISATSSFGSGSGSGSVSGSGSGSGPVSALVPVSATLAPAVPNEKVLLNAAKIAMTSDKPILLDYYNDTRSGSAFIGKDKDTSDRMLVKNKDEYTSPIQRLIRADGVGGDLIVLTENSVYIISGTTKMKEITGLGL